MVRVSWLNDDISVKIILNFLGTAVVFFFVTTIAMKEYHRMVSCILPFSHLLKGFSAVVNGHQAVI